MKCYVSTLPNGRLIITRLSPQQRVFRKNYDSAKEFITDAKIMEARQAHKLPKTMFELSRINNMLEHFDPVIHTLETIATGLPGHFPLACVEIDDNIFPKDRSERDLWEISGGKVCIKSGR